MMRFLTLTPRNGIVFIFDQSEATKNNYEFTECSVKDSTDCQSGSITNNIDTNSQATKNILLSCTPYNTYTLTVTQKSIESGNIIGQTSGKALCLYVRREVRTLSSGDLSKFLDASFVLDELSEEEGTKKYGGNFHPISYLTRFHHFNAAQQDQDHIHDGNGFLAQHLKMTNIFEQSVQSVDSTVALPYWDFTIDNALRYLAEDSFVMKASTYGEVKAPKDLSKGFTYADDKIIDGRITSGRWENLKVEMNSYYSEVATGYGYLRAPWNMNPSPYLSRFPFDFSSDGATVIFPTCYDNYKILQYDDMMDFFFDMAYGPHGSSHTILGGFFGCDTFNKMLEKGYIVSTSALYSMCSTWSFTLKELWRGNYITPRTGCTINSQSMESSVCGFDCSPDTAKLAIILFVYNIIIL
jgi:hypothetical protein